MRLRLVAGCWDVALDACGYLMTVYALPDDRAQTRNVFLGHDEYVSIT